MRKLVVGTFLFVACVVSHASAEEVPETEDHASALLEEAVSLMSLNGREGEAFEKATFAVSILKQNGRLPDALLGKALHVAGKAALLNGDVVKAEVESGQDRHERQV